jgi:hypothetical protein
MQRKRLRVDKPRGVADRATTDLRAYLDRLIHNLDDSSLRAVLKLMISESRGAVRKQQQLIALERPDGREAAGRDGPVAGARGRAEVVDDALFQPGRKRGPRHGRSGHRQGCAPSIVRRSTGARASTRTATAAIVHAFSRLPTIGKEQGASGGRISAAALEGELARVEPAPVRDRQGRHGAGPSPLTPSSIARAKRPTTSTISSPAPL